MSSDQSIDPQLIEQTKQAKDRMSSEQSIDPQLIEQTKQQIRSLVQEIAQLAKSEATAEEFYAEFLPRVVTALAAEGGIVWKLDEHGRLAIQYQINLQKTHLPYKDEEDQQRHGRILQNVMTTGEGALVQPHSGFGDAGEAANPTDFLLVLGPLKTELEVVGVVEVFQRSEAGPSTQKGYLRFLLQMCDLAGDFIKSRQLRHFSDRQVLWSQLEEFARQVHASLHPVETAYTIANEGRRLIECDRVSVAIRKGNRCVIESVSGQDLFDKRSNAVRLLGKLASVVVASEEPVWYTGDTRDLAPQVESAVQEYVDETHTKALAVLPLRRPVLTETDRERPDVIEETPPAIGALIVEQIEDSRLPAKMVQRVEVVGQHSATALANALEHENLFLMPVWRALGKTRWLVKARNLPKVALGAVAVVAVIVALLVVPKEFKPNANGVLEPVQRRDIFADVSGTVEEVAVRHDNTVAPGQLLVRLRNPALRQELTKIDGELSSAREQQRKYLQQLLGSRGLSPQDQQELEGRLQEARTAIRNLEIQQSILAEQVAKLEVRSPVAGEVITWDLYNRLNQRPVERGQLLLQVADSTADWQLELKVPDDRIGFIIAAQNELHAKLRQELRSALRADRRQKALAELTAQAEQAKAEAAVQAEAVQLASNSPDAPQEPEQPTPAEPAVEQPVTEEQPAEQQPVEPAAEGQTPEPAAPAEPAVALTPEDEARIEQEVEAEMAKTPNDQLGEKLRILTGQDWDDRLPVEYKLASNSGETYYGRLITIGQYAEIRDDEGNTVLVKVAIDKSVLSDEYRRHGTTVTAKIACGPRSLGFVWFHNVVAFFQKLWFRWF